jgi:hypothetical protein
LAGAVCGLLGKLKAVGYRSPIGLQCYAVQGDKRENLRQSIKGWQGYVPHAAENGTSSFNPEPAATVAPLATPSPPVPG